MAAMACAQTHSAPCERDATSGREGARTSLKKQVVTCEGLTSTQASVKSRLKFDAPATSTLTTASSSRQERPAGCFRIWEVGREGDLRGDPGLAGLSGRAGRCILDTCLNQLGDTAVILEQLRK